MQITVFTHGKNPPKNEDAYGYNETTFAVCDGSTGKKSMLYGGKTGGEIAADLVVQTALASELNGVALAKELTLAIAAKYKQLGATIADTEFVAVMVCARLVRDELIVTQVGDTAFRVNGTDEYANPPLIGELMANVRSEYIQRTGDVAGGREYIMPLLLNEHLYRNAAGSPAGFAEIDGRPIPERFVRTFTFKRSEVKVLEIYTDGYYAVPAEPTAEAFEQLHARIEREDPDKWKQYRSTKSRDDRTVMIIDFTS